MKCIKCKAEAVRKKPHLCAKCAREYQEYLGPRSVTLSNFRGSFISEEDDSPRSETMEIESTVESELNSEAGKSRHSILNEPVSDESIITVLSNSLATDKVAEDEEDE